MHSGKCKEDVLRGLQAVLFGLIAQLHGKLQLPEFVLNWSEENGLNETRVWHCFLSVFAASLGLCQSLCSPQTTSTSKHNPGDSQEPLPYDVLTAH